MNHKNIILPISGLVTIVASIHSPQAAELVIHQSPLFLTTSAKPNVLVIMDNSNSMDESSNGSAVGSASPNSKSEIARGAVKNLIAGYTGKINMGLMAYQQASVKKHELHNSPYDVSYNAANYDPAFTGPRNSLTKRFRMVNESNPSKFVYYNIALPFYSKNNFGNAYCYSANAEGLDNGSETYPAGPWDTYRCFGQKTNTLDNLPAWRNAASESASGYAAYKFGGRFSPTDSDLAQGLLDFGDMMAWSWVSKTWFSNRSPGRGYLHTEIKNLDAPQVGMLNTKLGTSQFVINAPTNPAYTLQNAGLTPLEGTLKTAKEYFAGNGLPGNEGGPVNAIPESCGKDFITLLTDGLPSTRSNGGATTNPALALTDVTTVANNLKSDGIHTYMIGFSLPTGTDPASLDTVAAAGGTHVAYLADDPASLQIVFDNILNDILMRSGASSSAATNSTSLSTDSFVYQARFSSVDWSGQLLAKEISVNGLISLASTWDAKTQLNLKPSNDRVILTYSVDTHDGIPFRWATIDSMISTEAKDILNSTDALGANRVNFLRGGSGGASSSIFRARENILGDIITSAPFYVGAPSAGYNDFEMPDYSAFRTTYLERTPILYTGANDGMLHGFNTETGDEVLAYIPREVFPNLPKLTASGYGGPTSPHHYFVDGGPIVADANVDGWKTILAGGLNAGGQGIYALDITDPSTFSEANAANIVLWEFSDEDDADLGYSYIQPSVNGLTHQSAQIAKMANGKWAVIFGNGYNNTEADGHASTTGHAYLYILFIEDGVDGTWTLGTDYIKLDTGVGSVLTPNGMATPNPIDTDGDGDIDLIYAGDLQGNLWKFDVSNAATHNWENPISGSHPLFKSQNQPITSIPLVTGHPDGGYMIGFGTGKYMELTDITSTGGQTFYALRDDGTSNIKINGRAFGQLVEQTIERTKAINGDMYRFTSDHPIDFTNKKGWFMDLPESGERIDVNPIIRDGRFIFITRTPSSAMCDAGGSSWLMELNYLTGGRLDISPFDITGDSKIDQNDIDGGQTPSGLQIIGGMVATPTPIDTAAPTIEYKVLVDTSGEIQSIAESKKPTYKGRISWRELR